MSRLGCVTDRPKLVMTQRVILTELQEIVPRAIAGARQMKVLRPPRGELKLRITVHRPSTTADLQPKIARRRRRIARLRGSLRGRVTSPPSSVTEKPKRVTTRPVSSTVPPGIARRAIAG